VHGDHGVDDDCPGSTGVSYGRLKHTRHGDVLKKGCVVFQVLESLHCSANANPRV
jgi:hypothetical protein